MYRLTEEGRKYLEKGLPEKRLLALLKGPSPISSIQQSEDFAIGLQWAKKNGWVKIEKGLIIPLKKIASLPEEQSLRRISEGREVEANLLSTLLQRKLVVQEKEDLYKRAEKQIQQGVSAPTPELISTGLWKRVQFPPYNVSVPGKKMYPGKRQPYNQFLEKVRRRLIELGFIEVQSQSIIQEFWNFDAIFQPQDHPSRDWTETYSLRYPKSGSLPDKKLVEKVKAAHEKGGETGSTGWGYVWDPKKASQLMPIAHDTALSPKTLSSNELKIPGKYFQIVRCFRPDVLDATHLIEFNQVGGFVVAEDLHFRNLLGVLEMFAKEIAGATQVKFLPDYYPFTEPSVQISAKHPSLGWVEFGGAGIFREEMTHALGVKAPVIAWGIGIDRLAMFKLGSKDIRSLFSADLRWLRESVMVK